MEFSRHEDKAVQQVIETKDENGAMELSEFQLALVGGGMGDVTLS